MAVLRRLKRGLVLIFCVSLAIFLLHTWNTEGKVWAFVVVCFTFNFSLFILKGACFFVFDFLLLPNGEFYRVNRPFFLCFGNLF